MSKAELRRLSETLHHTQKVRVYKRALAVLECAHSRLGYGWKRPRYVLTPDPQIEKKRQIRRVHGNLAQRSVVLIEDETALSLFSPLRDGRPAVCRGNH